MALYLNGNKYSFILNDLENNSLKSSISEFSQMNNTVSNYLSEADELYTNENGDTVSVISKYETSENDCDRPLSYPLSLDTGTLYIQSESSGGGWSLIVNNDYIRSSIANTVPGEIYQFLIKDNDGKLLDNGRINPTGKVRMLKFSGYIRNCRDLGGWDCDGGIVNYGKLFRSAVISAESQIDPQLGKNIGIKHELDLRGDSEANYTLESTLGSNVRYSRIPLNLYYADSIDPSKEDYENVKKVFKTIFDSVTHSEGLVYHCSIGRDRTGTITFMLLGLLGVEINDIDKDYELTGFSAINTPAYRTSSSYQSLKTYLFTLNKTSLRDNIVMWFLNAGFSLNELNLFRSAMINGSPDTLIIENFTSTEISFKNQIPLSTDKEGLIYNAIGYKKDVRINNAGEELESLSSYLTGFIPCTSGDIIRFKNLNISSSSSAYTTLRIGFFDANKDSIAAPYWSVAVNSSEGSFDEDGTLISLIVPTYANKVVAYARFSSYNINDESIITVNENIVEIKKSS